MIERCAVPVAELRPVAQGPHLSTAKLTRIFADMEKNVWSKPRRPMTDSTTIVEQDRNR